MAITPTLSKKINSEGKSEILLRVLVTRTFPVRVKSGIFIDPQHWLSRQHIDDIETRMRKEHDARNRRRKNKIPFDEATFRARIKPGIDIAGLRGKLVNPFVCYRHTPRHVISTNYRYQRLLRAIDRWIADIRRLKRQPPAAELRMVVDRFHNPKNYSRSRLSFNRLITLLEAIDLYIDRAPCRIQKSGNPINQRTITQVRQTRNHVENFLVESFTLQLPVRDVNKEFYDNFITYMNRHRFAMNTIGKDIKNIKACINALPMSQKINCEFIDPKKCVKLTEETDAVYLTERELLKLARCPLSQPDAIRVRDLFLLLAWTGCRFSDLPKLSLDNIFRNEKGLFFRIEQQKTGAKVVIPVLPETKRILDHYDYTPPKPLSAQKFNHIIKEICHRAGLNEKTIIQRTRGGVRETIVRRKYECVSAHTARRSFATNLYLRNFPSIMIMAITGHSTETAFMKYIRVSKEENAARLITKFNSQSKR